MATIPLRASSRPASDMYSTLAFPPGISMTAGAGFALVAVIGLKTCKLIATPLFVMTYRRLNSTLPLLVETKEAIVNPTRKTPRQIKKRLLIDTFFFM